MRGHPDRLRVRVGLTTVRPGGESPPVVHPPRVHQYTIYGGSLRTDLEFPNLRADDTARVDWTLEIRDEPAPAPAGELIGDGSAARCTVHLFADPHGGRSLVHSCTGTFVLAPDGAHVTWYRAPGAPDDVGCADVLGRVLPLIAHARGHFVAHAGATALADGVIAFLAPKGAGKSTLSTALALAGAWRVTDDALVLRPGTPVLAAPGDTTTRLRTDASSLLLADTAPSRAGADGKHVFDEVRASMPSLDRDRPLAALYLPVPVARERAEAPVRRVRLPAPAAVIALVQHAKVGRLLGAAGAADVFRLAAEIAAVTPVYRLEVVRDFGQLPDVVAQMLDWHGGALPTPDTSDVHLAPAC